MSEVHIMYQDIVIISKLVLICQSIVMMNKVSMKHQGILIVSDTMYIIHQGNMMVSLVHIMYQDIVIE